MTSQTSSEVTVPVQLRPLHLAWGATALAALTVAPLLAPHLVTLAGLVPRCLFKVLTGLPCPFCGTTRSAIALARLDVVNALIHYPLPTLGWLGFVTAGLVAGAFALARRPLPRVQLTRTVWAVVAIALLANWIYSIATGV